MTKRVSLQSRLIKTSLISSVVAGSVALLLFIIISTYHTMQVQDEIMDEISDMLLISDLTMTSGRQIDELSDEFNIEYRLSYHQQLLTQSKNFHLNHKYYKISFRTNSQYGLIWQNHQLWRSYHMRDADIQMETLLLQPLGERFKALLQSILGYSLILIMVWLLQWLISHVLIKRQFKVIHKLSNKISEKNADDLSPISTTPVEFIELQPMLGQLNKLLDRLSQSLQAEQRFTADASHELRSPLSAIQMRLQLIQRKYPERSAAFSQIERDVNRGIQILENLLLLARLDPEHSDNLPKTVFNLKTVINDVIQTLAICANEKNIVLKQEILLTDSELCIVAHQQLIFTCIRNILDNAIRYTPEYGMVELKVFKEDQHLTLTLENEGQGLSDAVLQRLGERFYRVLGSKTQGSGLGLSICKKIIQLHHGKISFNSSIYGGLKITIHLLI